MYTEQLEERRQYHYPPFYRLIKITLRHKNFNSVEEGAVWLGRSLTNIFKEQILGPSTPAISRVRNFYIRTIIIKIPQKQSLGATKKQLLRVKNSFQAIKEFRSIRFNIDVDNY
jgi:primosomal protein N' (replication factor Y)